jgi:hypothetical protein
MTKKIFVVVSILVALGSINSWGQDEGLGQNLGVTKNDARAFKGYTLFSPMSNTVTYLIDMNGGVVNTWTSDYTPGQASYLLEDGNLLRAGAAGNRSSIRAGGGGAGGLVQEFKWDGELVWNYKTSTDKYLAHHDVEKLPNGNVLIIAWESKTGEEAASAGRNADMYGNRSMLVDHIFEVEPTGKTNGEIVWEWHVWDHLVQDFDPSKKNYGDVASHPELIDINIGNSRRGRGRGDTDWNHINSVDYNVELDQIILSVKYINEIWIIDHGTTTEEAAGHSGGKRGKGGDLLYRWGNPQTYKAGNASDQQLFVQHDAHWVSPGLPGEGNILVFSNGDGWSSSSVVEIIPPLNSQGLYTLKSGKAFGPAKPVWNYTSSSQYDFSSRTQSGSQRLPNGNTLISSSETSFMFEVTPEKDIVWEYTIPWVIRSGSRGGFFKGNLYAPDYPGLKGRDLTPKDFSTEVQFDNSRSGKGGGKTRGKRGKR